MTDQYYIYVGARCQHFRPVQDVSARGMPRIWPDLHVCEGARDVELSRTVLYGLLRNIYYCCYIVQVRKEAEGRQLGRIQLDRLRLHTRHGEPHMCAHSDLPRTDNLC
jgi:hypothetical protein